MNTSETIRKNAETDIRESMHESGLSINPGDLDDKIPNSIRISTTKEEFTLYLFEKSYLRPAFKLDESSLDVPVLFAKADKNSQEFVSEIREKYRLSPNSIMMLSGFHILKRSPINSGAVSIFAISPDGMIDASICNQISGLANIKPVKRRAIYHAIENIVKIKSDIPEIANLTAFDILIYAISENEKVLSMFNESHYEDTPPKCVIVDSGKSSLNACALVRLLFMHMLCFDIVVASYKSYSSIENYFPNDFFDVHYFEGKNQDYGVTKPKPSLVPLLLWLMFGFVVIYVVLHWGLKLF